MPNTKQRTGKPGRPTLPKGIAKQSIVPVRFSDRERKLLLAAARANKTTVSGWIRSTLQAAMGLA